VGNFIFIPFLVIPVSDIAILSGENRDVNNQLVKIMISPIFCEFTQNTAPKNTQLANLIVGFFL